MSLFELGLLPAARTIESLGFAGESVAAAKLPMDKWPKRQCPTDRRPSVSEG